MTVDSARTDQPSIGQIERTRTMRVPRTRGAISGLLLIVLGAWGALAPFIGPYFDFSYGTDQHWMWSDARGWLEVLPGAVAGFGGLVVLVSKNRVQGSFGAWLAILGGAWFVVGRSLASVWHIGSVGEPLSTRPAGRAAADLAYFYGLGALIIFLASFALGRLAVVGVRDLIVAERDETRAAEAAAAAEAARRAELDRQRQLDEEQARRAAERDAAGRDVGSRTAADERHAAEAGVAGAGVGAAAEARSHHRVADERAADGRTGDRVADERAAADRAAEERVGDGRTDTRVADGRADERAADQRAAGEPIGNRTGDRVEDSAGRVEDSAGRVDDRASATGDGRSANYDPNDGRSDGFGHSPAHSADPRTSQERNPYDQQADER